MASKQKKELAIITKEGVMAVIGAAQEDATALEFMYGSESSLSSGFVSNVKMATGNHTMVVDEPRDMPGGQNKGPNPLDVMIASLGTCQEITYRMYATVMGLDIKSISTDITGYINLNGLVGNGGPVAFTKIQGTVTLESDEPEEKLNALKKAVDAHCPMCKTLCQEVAIKLTLKYVKDSDADAVATQLKKDPVQQGPLQAVIAAGKEDNAALDKKYNSKSKLDTQTLHTKVEMPLGHKMIIDEPRTMPGGNDLGPNPLDVFCASIGTCQEITWKMFGQVMGVPVSKVSAKVEGAIDLRGLVGLKDEAVAFKSINVVVTVNSPAAQTAIEGLKGAVDSHCPLVQTVKGKIPVDLSLVVKKVGSTT